MVAGPREARQSTHSHIHRYIHATQSALPHACMGWHGMAWHMALHATREHGTVRHIWCKHAVAWSQLGAYMRRSVERRWLLRREGWRRMRRSLRCAPSRPASLRPAPPHRTAPSGKWRSVMVVPQQSSHCAVQYGHRGLPRLHRWPHTPWGRRVRVGGLLPLPRGPTPYELRPPRFISFHIVSYRIVFARMHAH